MSEFCKHNMHESQHCGSCGMDFTNSVSKKHKEILEYCRPHIKLMWAAKIVSVVLTCDFRDAELELKVYDRLQKEQVKK